MAAKISRYQTPKGAEAEFQPRSHGRVLRNLHGITRKRDMDQTEYSALVRVQKKYLKKIETTTQFTAALLCQMHHDWLADIYPWAGRYRTVELQKGSFRWPPAFRVARNMEKFEHDFLARHTPCRPAPLSEVAQQIAQVHAEFLLIHPFREGNGRLARWLADLMSLQAGYPIPKYIFSGKGSDRREKIYLKAVMRGYGQDYDLLTAFFADTLKRRLEEIGR